LKSCSLEWTRTRVLPRQKLGEERVVVCQGLAGGSGVGRCPAGGSEVGELIAGLLSVVLDVLGNRAYGLGQPACLETGHVPTAKAVWRDSPLVTEL